MVEAKESAQQHYRPALADLSRHYELDVRAVSSGSDQGWDRLDILLSHTEHSSESVLAIRRAVESNLPALMVMDGILEWRNSWAHPRAEFGGRDYPMYQPAMAHKIACLGRSQARVLESWGNLGKCEIVGAPRLDPLIGRSPRHRQEGEPFRLLVMTARNPGFTDAQRDVTRRSLLDVKVWCDAHHRVGKLSLQIAWRLTAGLAADLGVRDTSSDVAGDELVETLGRVDAVLTTPSTAMLEAMLHGIPVGLLDYHNCPQYVPAAWTISAPEQIGPVVQDLMAAPPHRLLYQSTVLHDALECRVPAAPRMADLIWQMARVGRECRAADRSLGFPRRLLPDPQDGHHLPEEAFEHHRLFPGHREFSGLEAADIRIELGYTRAELRRVRAQCDRLSAQPANARPSSLMRARLIGPVLRRVRGLKLRVTAKD